MSEMKWIVVLMALFVKRSTPVNPPPGPICPRGFTRHFDRCYYISPTFETFDRANAICKGGKSEILAPVTSDDYVAMNSILTTHRTKCRRGQNCDEFWIGVHNKSGGSNWETTAGFEIETDRDCQEWAPFYPRETAGKCVIASYKESYKNKFVWRNTDCNKLLKFVCIKCPNGFDYAPEVNECFYFHTTKATWSTARQNCSQLKKGAALLMIQNKMKQKAVERYLKARIDEKESEICVTNLGFVGGKSLWTSGQTTEPDNCGASYVWKPEDVHPIPFTYTNWFPGMPNCGLQGENCAMIMTSPEKAFYWEDHVCDDPMCFVCEF